MMIQFMSFVMAATSSSSGPDVIKHLGRSEMKNGKKHNNKHRQMRNEKIATQLSNE